MKLEEIKNRTKEATDYLVASLEACHSEVLTQYLGATAKFHTYSFGNIMLIARQKPLATNVAGEQPGPCMLLRFNELACRIVSKSAVSCTSVRQFVRQMCDRIQRPIDHLHARKVGRTRFDQIQLDLTKLHSFTVTDFDSSPER